MSTTRDVMNETGAPVQANDTANDQPSVQTEDYNVNALEQILQDGKARFAEGDVAGAADCFRQLVALERNNKPAWNNLGVAMHVQAKWNEAIEAFSMALSLDPTDKSVRHNLRTILMDTDNDGRMGAEVLVKYGEELHTAGRMADAHEQFVLALQSNDEHAEAWNDLGVTLLQLGRTEAAEQAFDRALAIDPNDTNAINNRATLYVALGRIDEAKAGFLSVLDIDPFDALAPERLVTFELMPLVAVAIAQSDAKVRRAVEILEDAGIAAMARAGIEPLPSMR